ncbi:c-type cytochrome [Microvirga tunisiensis]|uniref:C-type cytochrome n=2 Tax=Pannonibacter tanglangensis TaxID=2750084 RepID=A0A7X5F594_9HYPH|nr:MULTISPECIES: cytochrome c family protein [unclassified Pannonibacter]NBN65767.1 c-type cytochrome [Pannonibacter sp. XCT-34]NBN80006.1 c-type cytochrome [Pannonibacter sp. XCT-53]
MDSFELNKAAGAVLMVLLLTMGVGIVSDVIFTPTTPEKPGYEIVVASAESAAPAEEAAADVAPLSERLMAGTVEDGEKAAKKCAACHSFEKGGPNKVGPDLWGLLGRKPGTHAGFSYSTAMVAFGEANPAWTFEHLYAFLENPKAHVPGTSMGFAGIKKADERVDLIVYMNSLSDSPLPLQ